jgi:hypothetical protein
MLSIKHLSLTCPKTLWTPECWPSEPDVLNRHGAAPTAVLLLPSTLGQERKQAGGRVVGADGVVGERLITCRRVLAAGAVLKEGSKTSGCVEAGGVAVERSVTVGRVGGAANVVRE